MPDYSVLIRTFNSEATLPATLASLARQSLPPAQYVVVDSGSRDGTLSLLPAQAEVIAYRAPRFNYAAALNLGIDPLACPYTLVLSSHTALDNGEAIAQALAMLEADATLGAVYFADRRSGPFNVRRIDAGNFNGSNGVWNTCGLYRTALLKQRRFREEVFSAEDQEWSAWLLGQGGWIAQVSGGGMNYARPGGHSLKKWLAEEVAVAVYAKPSQGRFPYLFRVGYRVVRPRSSWRNRWFNLVYLATILAWRVSPGGVRSRIESKLAP